jgi:hypothetical protein
MKTTRAQRKSARRSLVPWWTTIFHRTIDGGWGLLEWRVAYRYGLKTYISPEEMRQVREQLLGDRP